MNLNIVQICGRLTRKPELKSLPSGTKVASFSVASNRSWKGNDGQKKEEVEFHNVVTFGRTAEVIVQYFNQGDEIYIQGRLKTSNWEKAGVKHYKTEIVGEKFEFGQKSRANSDGGATESRHSEPKVENTIEYPEEEINPKDIPF